MSGVVVQHAQRRPDDRVALREVPVRGIGLGPSELGPNGRHQKQIEEPIEDHLLAGLVFPQLVGEERDERGIPPGVNGPVITDPPRISPGLSRRCTLLLRLLASTPVGQTGGVNPCFGETW